MIIRAFWLPNDGVKFVSLIKDFPNQKLVESEGITSLMGLRADWQKSFLLSEIVAGL
jgi:hypothetical protein